MTKKESKNTTAELPLAEQVVTESPEKRAWRYFHSAMITFLSVFLPLILIEITTKSFDDIWVSGVAGVTAILVRTIFKASYEALIVLLPKLITKLK